MTTDYFSLSGKTALVIGHGSGIGEVMSIGLAETGSNFIDVPGTIAKANSAEKEVATKRQTNFLFYAIDLDKRTLVYQGVKEIKSAKSSIDIFINNAGSILIDLAVNHTDEYGDKGSLVP